MQATHAALLCTSGWLCLAAAGCGSRQQSAVAASPPPEPVGVTCLGRITPGDRIIRVSAPPQAIVKQLRVVRGSQVKAGQELAILRDYDIAAANLAGARTDVAVAETGVAQAKAGEKSSAIAAQQAAIQRQQALLLSAEKDFERKQELSRGGLLSGAELDVSRLALETARDDLNRESELLNSLMQVRPVDVQVAEMKLAAAKAKEAYARMMLDQSRIFAPSTGTVLEIHAYPGETVSGDGLLDLGDLTHMFVEAEVYVSDLPRVREGAAAAISGLGFTGTVAGRVVEILRQASDNRLYPPDAFSAADKRVIGVRIRLDEPGKLRNLSNSQVSVRIEP